MSHLKKLQTIKMISLLLYVLMMCVCPGGRVCPWHAKWRSEDNFIELVLVYIYVGSGSQTQVARP